MKTMKYKNRVLRVLAIWLALIMVMGEPVRAIAAEPDNDQVEFEQEIFAEDNLEESWESEDVAEDFELEDDSEDFELSPEAVDAMINADTADIESEDIDLLSEGETEEIDVEADEQDDAEKALQILRDSGALSVPRLGATAIPESEYAVTRYADYVKIENKNSGTSDDKDKFLYAVLVKSDVTSESKLYVLGTAIAPNSSTNLSMAYSADRSTSLLDKESDYVLWIGRGDTYTDEETGNTAYYGFKLLGYVPELDAEGNLTGYKEADMQKIPVAHAESYAEYAGEYKDGYSGIKMKAIVQKNLTSVKISWSPNRKDDTQKQFKKYSLYKLDSELKETAIFENKSSKSATDKNIKVESDALLYLLKCYDSAGALKAQYVTCAAPYILQMSGGERSGDFDFTMTQRANADALYVVQLAAKNKENDGVKVTTGFQDAWSKVYQVDDIFNSTYNADEFYVSKTLHKPAVTLSYDLGQPVTTMGATYYGRVQAIRYVDGLKVTSAPSNVRSCKAGPQKCRILTAAGVYYDTASAKKNNYYNIQRASKHIESWFNDVQDDDENPISSDMYVHSTNKDVCAKNGLIYFWVDNEAMENIKSFELLKCDHENGTFKKVKSYTLKNPALMECEINSSFFEGLKVYAMFYNKFTPEKDAYYAVRAVAKAKSAPGGHGNGYRIVPEMDRAHGLFTQNAGADKIVLSWTADDCAKQYWLYRSTRPYSGTGRTKVGESGETLIAKINTSKAKKFKHLIDDDPENPMVIKYLYYTDSSKSGLKIDTPYYYYVRPVYDTKAAANDNTKYMDKASDEVRGKASALYAQIKNFKAANEACEKIKISFNQVKNLKKYRIFRLEVDSDVKKLNDALKPDLTKLYEEADKIEFETFEDYEDYLSSQTETYWKQIMADAGWEYIYTVPGSGTTTAAKSYVDPTAEVGHYYFYLVQGASDKSSGINFSYSGRVRNMPLPIANANATFDGHNIKLTYGFNSKETNRTHLRVYVNPDGRGYERAGNTEYTDNNVQRGKEHTYEIKVVYNDGTVKVESSVVTVKYSLPAGIEVTLSGAGSLEDSTIIIKKGESAKVSYRAYLSDGKTAAYNNIGRSSFSSPSDCIAVTEAGSNYFTFEAKKKGTTAFNLECAGITRKITIIVNE